MGRYRLLVVVGCVVCLLALTVTLPAADPRLDNPSAGQETTGDDWDTLVSDGEGDDTTDEPDQSEGDDQSGDQRQEQPTDGDDTDDDNTGDDGDDTDDQSTEQTVDIGVEGDVHPGSDIRVTVEDRTDAGEAYDILLNGETIGTTDDDELQTKVPYADEMTIAVPETSVQETIEIPTAVTVEFEEDGPPVQNQDRTVTATIDGKAVRGLTVSVDGQQVNRTDADGDARVQIPARVGTSELRVERGAVNATTELALAEPTVAFTSVVLFPLAPAPVRVTTQGVPVQDATVSVPGGGTGTTGEDGYTRVSLPVDNQATATLAMEGSSATATARHLYIRVTVVFVVLPGLVLGLVYSYIRFAVRRESKSAAETGSSGDADVVTALVMGLADAMADLLDLLSSASLPKLSMPSLPSWRAPKLPRPSLSSLVPSLPRPSAPSPESLVSGLLPSGGRDSSGGISLPNPFSSDDDKPEEAEGPSLADEPLGPPEPGTEVRTLWHAFLDRTGIRSRETLTPGQVAQRALASGFPARQVQRLLCIFRSVEYGDTDPSPEDVDEARAATRELLDHASTEDTDD